MLVSTPFMQIVPVEPGCVRWQRILPHALHDATQNGCPLCWIVDLRRSDKSRGMDRQKHLCPLRKVARRLWNKAAVLKNGSDVVGHEHCLTPVWPQLVRFATGMSDSADSYWRHLAIGCHTGGAVSLTQDLGRIAQPCPERRTAGRHHRNAEQRNPGQEESSGISRPNCEKQ